MNASSFAVSRRVVFLAGIVVVLLVIWGFLHRQIQGSVAARLLLNTTSPRQETFFDLAKQANDPVAFLKAFWVGGKIPHRQLVMAFLNANATANPSWLARAEPLVWAGTVDPDASVRELALAILGARNSPRLLECAAAQLNDVDPMLRLVGLQYLRKAEPRRALPLVVPLLDDSDLRVVAEAEVTLARWSGQDYGVRVYQAVPRQEGEQAGRLDPGNVATIRHGVELRKQWWQAHAKEYGEPVPEGRRGESAAYAGEPLRAADFKLKDLNGRTVRLSQLRGKVVLINFWASWCSACLAEIPDLIALQTKVGDKVAIVGVALDGLPDEDGEHDDGQSQKGGASAGAVRAKVERAVKARGINYPVWWDPRGGASSQFNGGELPTTVILDSEGRVRRRFIGERSLKVFEAMLAEVRGPSG